jgi:hypothetical protein
MSPTVVSKSQDAHEVEPDADPEVARSQHQPAVTGSNAAIAQRAAQARARRDDNVANYKNFVELFSSKATELERASRKESAAKADSTRLAEIVRELRRYAGRWQEAADEYGTDSSRAMEIATDAGNEIQDMLALEQDGYDIIEEDASLEDKYGLRPKGYRGFFDDSNKAERQFTDRLPKLVAELNAKAEARELPFRFSMAELAVNFISEGGAKPLERNTTENICGFAHVGTDTWGEAATQRSLRPWYTREASKWKKEEKGRKHRNELGEYHKDGHFDSLMQAFDANAMMFAQAREGLFRMVTKLGYKWEELDKEAVFFWTTVYYNAGPAMVESEIKKHGVDYWKKKWTSGDNHRKFSKYYRYNALWRTSTWEWMERFIATEWAPENIK